MNARAFAVVALLVAAGATTASAQSPAPNPDQSPAQGRDPVTAEALFRTAREAVLRGDYAAACPKFEESQRLDPSVGTLMNMADCKEREGRLAKAWEYWHEAADQLTHAGDDRAAMARTRVAALDKRVPRLTVRLVDGAGDAQVARDGVVLGAASLGLALPVDPGSHRLVVTASGRAPAERTVDLAEGQALEIALEAGPPGTEAAPTATPAGTDGARWRRTAGYAALGVGGAALVVTVISGLVVVHEKSVVSDNCGAGMGCNQTGLDATGTGKTWLTVNTVSSVVTLAAAGLGIALVVTSRSGNTKVVPAATSGGAGIALLRSF